MGEGQGDRKSRPHHWQVSHTVTLWLALSTTPEMAKPRRLRRRSAFSTNPLTYYHYSHPYSYQAPPNGESSTAGEQRGYGQHVPPSVVYKPGYLQQRYDPYSTALPDASPQAAQRPPSHQTPMPVIRFKYSPFFRIDKIVTAVIPCPGKLKTANVPTLSHSPQNQRLLWIAARSR